MTDPADDFAALGDLGKPIVTGVYAVLVRSIAAVVTSMANSYIFSFVDIESAVVDTLSTTGRAMTYTSIVLAAGFLGFTLSSMWNLVNFGLLVTLTIAIAFVAELLLGPALLSLADHWNALADRR